MKKKNLSMLLLAGALVVGGCAKQADTASVDQSKTTPLAPANTTEQTTSTTSLTTVESGSQSSGAQILDFDQKYPVGDNGDLWELKGKLEVDGGIVKSISVDGSTPFLAAFTGGINEQIIGKPLKGLHIDTISGASLTSQAFNDFLAKVGK